jgi:hypothetical protein
MVCPLKSRTISIFSRFKYKDFTFGLRFLIYGVVFKEDNTGQCRKISIKVLSYLLNIKKPLQNATALISESGIIRDTAIPYGT